MKKILVTACIAIVVISLLTIPPLLQPPMSNSQGTPQTTPISTPQATPQSTIQPTPQSTPKPTPTRTTQPNPQNTPQPTQQTTMPPSNRTLQEAIGNATMFLDKSNEPYAMLMLNVIYRRFGIDEFADSLQLYDAALANSSSEDAHLLRVFRRMAAYDNSLQAGDLMAVDAETDRVTVPALYCNQFGLDDDYPALFAQAANGKDYLLTHALLATIWIQENHYQLPLSSSSIEKLFQDNADLIGNDPVITDLELEAATFLYMAGQGSMVNSVFIQNVVAAQNVDGGWRLSNNMPLDSNWHTSVLGLLLLLHIQNPSYSYPPMLAPAPN